MKKEFSALCKTRARRHNDISRALHLSFHAVQRDFVGFSHSFIHFSLLLLLLIVFFSERGFDKDDADCSKLFRDLNMGWGSGDNGARMRQGRQ